MGIPKFYRWISERYPCLSQVVKDYQVRYGSRLDVQLTQAERERKNKKELTYVRVELGIYDWHASVQTTEPQIPNISQFSHSPYILYMYMYMYIQLHVHVHVHPVYTCMLQYPLYIQ